MRVKECRYCEGLAEMKRAKYLEPVDVLGRASKNESGCLMWQFGKCGHGYGSVFYKGRVVGAHRALWEMMYGPLRPDQHVLHSCDTPGCVNPDHLRVGTAKDNMADREARGRNGRHTKPESYYGANFHPHPKLTPEDVTAIRASQLSTRKAAAQFGVHHTTIWGIRRGAIWPR